MVEGNHGIEGRNEEEREERRRLLRRYSLLAAAAAIFSSMEFDEGDEQEAYEVAVRHARGLLEEIRKQEAHYEEDSRRED